MFKAPSPEMSLVRLNAEVPHFGIREMAEALGLPRIVLSFSIGTVLVILPATAALISPLMAVPLAATLAYLLANYAGREAPAALIFATTFQNLLISLLSPLIPDNDAFNLLRGFVFMETVTIWLVMSGYFWQQRAYFPREIRQLMFGGIAILAVIGFYMAIGFVQVGTGAIIYTRNIATPILLFQIALLTASRGRLNITPFLLANALSLFVCGYIELLDRPLWLDLTNGHSYWALNLLSQSATGFWESELKNTGFVYRDLYDFFRIDLFNTSYLKGVQILRLHGPNIHAIAFGYSLAFCCLFLFASRQRVLALLALPLLVFASAKGAMIELMFVGMGWALTKIIGARIAALGVGLVAAAYSAAMIITGLSAGDYHIIGLMGGIQGFISNPIGHGIGLGGNLNGTLSVEAWQEAQATGAVQGAVESAVGVLLYQMGAAALAVLGFYGYVAAQAWRIYARTGVLQHGLAAWGTAAILINGIFQEEALFSPLAMGLMISFAGIVLGAASRAAPAPNPTG